MKAYKIFNIIGAVISFLYIATCIILLMILDKYYAPGVSEPTSVFTNPGYFYKYFGIVLAVGLFNVFNLGLSIIAICLDKKGFDIASIISAVMSVSIFSVLGVIFKYRNNNSKNMFPNVGLLILFILMVVFFVLYLSGYYYFLITDGLDFKTKLFDGLEGWDLILAILILWWLFFAIFFMYLVFITIIQIVIPLILLLEIALFLMSLYTRKKGITISLLIVSILTINIFGIIGAILLLNNIKKSEILIETEPAI